MGSFSFPSKLVFLAPIALAAALQADEWPQYRGAHHNGSSAETLPDWKKEPKALWKVKLQDGFSSFTAANNRLYTLVSSNIDGATREVCVALDAASGKQLWASPLAVAKYTGGGDSGTSDNKGGDGARSTPVVDGDRVYVLDSKLLLACLDAASGKSVWSVDLVKDHAAKNITWQNAASPVIDGENVFVAGGGEGQSLLAFKKKDGKLAWKGENDQITHATPTVATIHGARQVIFFTQSGLASLDTKSGKVLWRHPFKYSTSTAASPVVGGDIVFCSAGYGVGSGAAKISKVGDKFEAKEIWRNQGNKMANHWSTPVYKDGYLYGMFSFKEYGNGPLKCVDIKTGVETWSQPDFGPGNVILVNNRLVALSDAGQIVLVDANPKAYKELGRVKALAGKCWSTPILSNGIIFARSTTEGTALNVKTELSSK